MRAAPASLALLALAAPLAARQAVTGNGESWALFRGWSAARRVDFSVPAGPCTRAAEALAHELGSARAVALDPDDRDPAAVRVLIGASWDGSLLALLRPCGIEPMAGGFCLLGREYAGPGDALRAVFEDPLQPGRPLCVLLGNDLERLAAYLDELPRLSRPALTVWSGGDLALESPLSPSGALREGEARDYLARRERYFAGGLSLEVGDVRVHLRRAGARELWQEYALALVRACKTTLDWFGVKSRQAPPVELFLYAHPEDLEECLGTTASAVTSRLEPRAHVLFSETLPHDGGRAVASVLAREVAGTPAAEWLAEGQALAAAGTFFGWPLEQWLGHLAQARQLGNPDRLVRSGAGAEHDALVLAPARALLFLQAVEQAQPGAVRALWKGAPLEARRVGLLYQRAVKRAGEAYLASRRRAQRERATPFLRGLALVESERVRYSSSWVDEALAEAAALEPRPDAVSLTVLASAEDPLPLAVGGARRTAHGNTSDLALASASAAARSAGFAVVLALEVLAQPNGAWADTLPWASPEDRWDYWSRYERVALHYALLAELLEADVFSFGANLRTTPAGHFEGEEPTPEQAVQRALAWRNLIARLRSAYRGGLTYGAGLPGSESDVLFYEHLDYLGWLLFPSVAEGAGAPDDEQLRRGVRFEVQRALDLAVRWNKPLLLLQTGFPARRDSWGLPLVPRGPDEAEAQARFLATLAEVLGGELENGDALRGFFLWNWPIDPEPARAGDRGFSLRGRSLEASLGRLFTR